MPSLRVGMLILKTFAIRRSPQQVFLGANGMHRF